MNIRIIFTQKFSKIVERSENLLLWRLKLNSSCDYIATSWSSEEEKIYSTNFGQDLMAEKTLLTDQRQRVKPQWSSS